MLRTTVRDLLQGNIDEQIKDHKIYLVSDPDTFGNQRPAKFNPVCSILLQLANLDAAFLNEAFFYVGQTNNPKDRLYRHLFNIGQRDKSELGIFIIQNFPSSLNWSVRLLTLKDCESLLLCEAFRHDLVCKCFSDEEYVDRYFQNAINNLPSLFPGLPEKAQAIKDQLQEPSLTSISMKREALEKILDSHGIKIYFSEEKDIFTEAVILERLYNPDYAIEFSKRIEIIFMRYFIPFLNKQGNEPFAAVPAKYNTTGLNLRKPERYANFYLSVTS